MNEPDAHLAASLFLVFPSVLFLALGFGGHEIALVLGAAQAILCGYHWREFWRKRGVVLKRGRKDWE